MVKIILETVIPEFGFTSKFSVSEMLVSRIILYRVKLEIIPFFPTSMKIPIFGFTDFFFRFSPFIHFFKPRDLVRNS